MVPAQGSLQYRLGEPEKLQYTSADIGEYDSSSQLILAQIMIYSLAYNFYTVIRKRKFFSINNIISGNCGKMLH